MGWFNKTKKEEKKESSIPELPKLPDIPNLDDEPPKMNLDSQKTISQLPMFPNNSLGDKFSQDTIKDAITGKKEETEEFEADDSEEDQMTPKIPQITHVPEFYREGTEKRNSYGFRRVTKKVKEEPLFIRLDKFEESLHNFEEIKQQIAEIEKILQETKEIKEKEGAELESWEKEIKAVKEKIQNIDREIFSKID